MLIPKNQFTRLKLFVTEMQRIPVEDVSDFNASLALLLAEYRKDMLFGEQLNAFASLLLDQAHFVNAFTDYGISSSRGFFPELYSRIKHKLLPPKLEEDELSHFIRFLFPEKKNLLRLSRINSHNWQLILEFLHDEPAAHKEKIIQQLYNSILILSHRLTSLGIDPYVVKRLPKADDNDSPFFELNELVSILAKKHLQTHTQVEDEEIEAARKKLQQCESLLRELEEQKDRTGISLHLTFLIRLAFQQIERMKLLVQLFLSKDQTYRVVVISRLITELAIAEKERTSVGKFFNENTQLLAYRVISHASEKGEHYIGFSKEENRKLFRSAMGGGLVVVFLVYIKDLIHLLQLAPFGEGFLFGLNYAIGFVFMHLAHFTLATKQPAMTASYMAASLEGENIDIPRAARAFRQVMRSQFISLFGNLLIVLPLCFAFAYVLKNFCHLQVFTDEESTSQFYSNHPLLSASLFYAFITGIFLSISGYVTGYIDNKVVFSEIPYRIQTHPGLTRRFAKERLQKWAGFIETNAGAITGNVFLGFCLGMAGNIGKFMGLPFDIRHITISAGNFGIGLGSIDSFPLPFLLTVFAGVMGIGIINIISSFLISFALACRSRNLSWKQSLRLLAGIGS
ncbi:MAG: site-specific recombinase [Bacteroidetes bacterium]|jgi:site-specific recombinase|nr:site-specific recombinase [Bacteroidota bacterium]